MEGDKIEETENIQINQCWDPSATDDFIILWHDHATVSHKSHILGKQDKAYVHCIRSLHGYTEGCIEWDINILRGNKGPKDWSNLVGIITKEAPQSFQYNTKNEKFWGFKLHTPASQHDNTNGIYKSFVENINLKTNDHMTLKLDFESMTLHAIVNGAKVAQIDDIPKETAFYPALYLGATSPCVYRAAFKK